MEFHLIPRDERDSLGMSGIGEGYRLSDWLACRAVRVNGYRGEQQRVDSSEIEAV